MIKVITKMISLDASHKRVQGRIYTWPRHTCPCIVSAPGCPASPRQYRTAKIDRRPYPDRLHLTVLRYTICSFATSPSQLKTDIRRYAQRQIIVRFAGLGLSEYVHPAKHTPGSIIPVET